MTTVRLLTEIEVAHAAGFRRFRDFRRALKAARFPGPDVQLPDGPRWSETLLRNWLDRRGNGVASRAADTIASRFERAAAEELQHKGAQGR